MRKSFRMGTTGIYVLAAVIVLTGLLVNQLKPLVSQERFLRDAVQAHPQQAALSAQVAQAFIAADQGAPSAQKQLQRAAACAGFMGGVTGMQVFGEVGALAMQRLNPQRLGKALRALSPDPTLQLSTLVCDQH